MFELFRGRKRYAVRQEDLQCQVEEAAKYSGVVGALFGSADLAMVLKLNVWSGFASLRSNRTARSASGEVAPKAFDTVE